MTAARSDPLLIFTLYMLERSGAAGAFDKAALDTALADLVAALSNTFPTLFSLNFAFKFLRNDADETCPEPEV